MASNNASRRIYIDLERDHTVVRSVPVRKPARSVEPITTPEPKAPGTEPKPTVRKRALRIVRNPRLKLPQQG